jgi:hypothetical protein
MDHVVVVVVVKYSAGKTLGPNNHPLQWAVGLFLSQ